MKYSPVKKCHNLGLTCVRQEFLVEQIAIFEHILNQNKSEFNPLNAKRSFSVHPIQLV